jgi:hypothetical protein
MAPEGKGPGLSGRRLVVKSAHTGDPDVAYAPVGAFVLDDEGVVELEVYNEKFRERLESFMKGTSSRRNMGNPSIMPTQGQEFLDAITVWYHNSSYTRVQYVDVDESQQQAAPKS